ncbi:hypothetical protein N656DRAFT_794597 [Canariomyces notabilis]|uniref:Uncharacterized protein n=1 Tax=Canariomyces notabilis TaxID=2074819 RepID=A0AAN6YX88_9PEZI|nr:hypothetical protein N656DRAFT_794597 [Canariomyces arenarius]
MNPDDAMADSQTAEEGASHVHLNAQQQQPGNKPAVAAWNTKKFRDEYEISKHRLLDQKFSSTEYPDPLAPRPPHPKQYPKGTDPALERQLKQLIADIRPGAQ